MSGIRNISALIIFLFGTFSCISNVPESKKVDVSEVIHINLAEAIENPVNITAENFIESISYIPLATTPECLVDINPQVLVTKDYILITTGRRCLLFSRRNGAFIREIGFYGRGPGEYRSTFGFFNESASTYYFKGFNGSFVKYSLDGVYRGNVKIPLYDESLGSSSYPNVYSFINDTTLVCNFCIFNGTETKSLMIFSENGKIIKIVPNRVILKQKQRSVFATKEIMFYRFNNNLFFQSRYNDTVFNLTIDKILPSFIIDRGKYRPPFESRWWSSEKRQQSDFIYLVHNYFEDTRYLSFYFYRNEVINFALYDKSLKSIKVTANKYGIKNNFDGFVDLTFSSINNSGELSGLVQSSELIEWMNQYPDKFKALKPELQKLKAIEMGDNPIVVIAKYKQ